MVSDGLKAVGLSLTFLVLILVLMEYGLWLSSQHLTSTSRRVLILVLMEYGLWLGNGWRCCNAFGSLNPCSNGIWSLTFDFFHFVPFSVVCLNPCSNGIWSLTQDVGRMSQDVGRLNPCSNGIWSLTATTGRMTKAPWVLILVLMEYGLWPA